MIKLIWDGILTFVILVFIGFLLAFIVDFLRIFAEKWFMGLEQATGVDYWSGDDGWSNVFDRVKTYTRYVILGAAVLAVIRMIIESQRIVIHSQDYE